LLVSVAAHASTVRKPGGSAQTIFEWPLSMEYLKEVHSRTGHSLMKRWSLSMNERSGNSGSREGTTRISNHHLASAITRYHLCRLLHKLALVRAAHAG